MRNFAYPFASATRPRDIVARLRLQQCAQPGRAERPSTVPENAGADDCSAGCNSPETMPPGDPYYTKAPAQVRSNWSPDDFHQEIGGALTGGGGWVQLTFHGICPTDCSDITTPVGPNSPSSWPG